MIARSLLVALAGSLATVPSAVGADVERPSSEPFDVVYLSEARPVVVRMHLGANGWTAFADALFAKLDADKSGGLDSVERTKLNPTLAFLTGSNPRLQFEPAMVANGPVTSAAFREFLKKNNFGPLRLPPPLPPRQQRGGFRRGGMPTGDDFDKALLEQLDTDKNGKLSLAELKAGAAILKKLDTDENEIVGSDELLKRTPSPFFFSDFDNGMGAYVSPGVELIAVKREGTDSGLARRIISRYGPRPMNAGGPQQAFAVPEPDQLGFSRRQPIPAEPTVRRLGKKELNLGDANFAALDQDGDDELDLDELARFGASAKPEVEIALAPGKPARVVRAGQSPVKSAVDAEKSKIAIEVPGVRLDLTAPPALSGEAARAAFRNRYLERFRNADRDSNAYLDRSETDIEGFFREFFLTLDKDGDGKIYEKELTAVLDDVEPLVPAAAAGIVTVELNEMGKGIFGLIDADGDNRLKIRELRAMPKLIERFDANKDGSLEASEVPRRFEAKMTQGFSGGRSPVNFQQIRFGMMAAPDRPPGGPAWFQKMDRNRDGDVSRREFIGTDEQFQKLDADGDGLISEEEAEAAGK